MIREVFSLIFGGLRQVSKCLYWAKVAVMGLSSKNSIKELASLAEQLWMYAIIQMVGNSHIFYIGEQI